MFGYGVPLRSRLAIAVCLLAVVGCDSYRASFHNGRGLEYYRAGHAEAAAAAFRQALTVYPDLAEAHSNLGLAYEAQGMQDEAIASYRAALRIDPSLAVAHYNLAAAYDRLGKVPQAIKEYSNAVERDPDDIDARVRLAALLVEDRQPRRALPHARVGADQAPWRADAWAALGLALVQLGRPDEAVQAFAHASDLEPEDPELALHLGTACLAAGDLKAAELHLRVLSRQQPTFAEAHNNLGVVLHRRGDPAGAIGALEQALALRPHYVDAAVNLGDVYADMGLWEPAATWYQRARDRDPSSAGAWRGLARMFQAQGHEDLAAWALREALRWQPDDPEMLAGLALLYAAGAEPDPTPVDPAARVAYREAQARRAREAVVFARMAVELAEEDNRSLYQSKLAAVQARDGDIEGAVATLTRALAEDPGNSALEFQLAELEALEP